MGAGLRPAPTRPYMRTETALGQDVSIARRGLDAKVPGPECHIHYLQLIDYTPRLFAG